MCVTSVCCINSLPFTNALWPRGMVKCLLDEHFRFLPETVGHLGIFAIICFYPNVGLVHF